MAQDPEILYKLMVLYLLDQVSFPLTGSQLQDFFLEKEYTNYFTLQKIMGELEESGFLSSRQVGNLTHYTISDDGRATLRYFPEELSPAVIRDMDDYLQENKYRMRSEVSLTADYYKPDGMDYVVRLRVHEGKQDLLNLELAVPDEKSAKTIAANWRAKAQPIYQHLMDSLG